MLNVIVCLSTLKDIEDIYASVEVSCVQNMKKCSMVGFTMNLCYVY